MTVRVRFAPSPTGYLHIGGARTVLFNWLFARKHHGALVLRIEDTDTERTLKDSYDQILDSMRWLGLEWDEGPDKGGPYGPYRQSERKGLYREWADVLVEKGSAYRCFCSPEELETRRAQAREKGLAPRYDGRCRHLDRQQAEKLELAGRPWVLRLRTPDEGTTEIDDLIRGTVSFENEVIGDFVILKSDGMPTYNFACVVDDALMKLTHVIRGDEHLSNTPRQVMLYKAFNMEPPVFAHVPMILAPDRSKLSKRHGATSVEEFRDAGYLPEAILNYLVLLGWSPGADGQEFMSVEEMVERFSLDRVASTPAIYDVTKLAWMNGHYIREADPVRLMSLSLAHLQHSGLVPLDVTQQEKDRILELTKAVKDRVRTLEEMPDALSYFLTDDWSYEEKGVAKYFKRQGVTDLLRAGRTALSEAKSFSLGDVEKAYRELISKKKISGASIIHPTRLAITGRTVGPGLFHVISLLGREKTLERMEKAIIWIEENL